MAADQIIHRKEHTSGQACNIAISVPAKELGAHLIIEILSGLVKAVTPNTP
jgi:hypothetical protein